MRVFMSLLGVAKFKRFLKKQAFDVAVKFEKLVYKQKF